MKPKISIILIAYNMEREIKRTLYSLSAVYQKNITSSDYEVIVVDNGSEKPLSNNSVTRFGRNFKYYYLDNAPKSPARAINFGVEKSEGEIIGIIIDGARIVTPGILKYAKALPELSKNPVLATLSWHIGPEIQRKSIENGYTSEKEDTLLKSIDWERNGYRLFEISKLGLSYKNGWFSQISESNCLFLKKETFKKINGYDELFDLPGGGLLNLDFYKKLCDLPNSELFFLLGEGSFHQIHHGATTKAMKDWNELWEKYANQYFEIRGKSYSKPNKKINFIGHMPDEAIEFLKQPEK